MHTHAAKLRVYYLALRRGLATPGRSEVDVHWSEALVIEWFKLLRMPPYENAYPVRPASVSLQSLQGQADQRRRWLSDREHVPGWLESEVLQLRRGVPSSRGKVEPVTRRCIESLDPPRSDEVRYWC